MTDVRAIYDFVEKLNRTPILLARFEAQPAAVLAEQPLSSEHRNALLECSPAGLTGLGVHPLVMMRYSLARNPAIKAHISVSGYLAELKEAQ